MSIESERLEDELRFIVCAFREGLLWQRTCGASGLPAAPPSRKNTAPAFDAPIRNEQQGKASGGVESSKGSSSSIDSSPALPVADRLNLSVEQRLARLSDVATQIKTCERCGLCRGRKNVVYGTGAIDVDIMIVGEGPGVEEDLQGIPFVGKAGQLLDKMLAAMGYARSQVYIGNVVKCRPPNNRVPEDDEIGACMPYL
ncbi:MAG TPA: uracil-DNA glycosylase, partial [Polyangiaceae bacterium]|nr:uracil-DNA glycosylase [Polyangiaceae bacterium]